MTGSGLGTSIAALLAVGAGAVGSGVSETTATPDAGGHQAATALVVDAALARDGRDLIAPRLRSAAAELRIPRTPAEALMDVRYLDALGYRVIAVGPDARTAVATAALLP
jgi:hypothetical protein